MDEVVGEVTVPLKPAGDDSSPLIRLDIKYPVPLRVAVAGRTQVGQLNEWADAGVYLLLDRPREDGTWTCYVGKSAAPRGVKGRLGNHLQDSSKPNWYRAVAVCAAGDGWDEAEVAWLEGHLHGYLSGASRVSLSNTQAPSPGRLSRIRQMPLVHVEEVLNGVLALIGHAVEGGNIARRPPSPRRAKTESPSRRMKGKSSVLNQMVETGFVPAGTRIFSTYQKWPGEGRIRGDGRIETSRRTFDSLSKAGNAITGGSVNGWRFWAVGSPTGDTLATLRDRFQGGESTT